MLRTYLSKAIRIGVLFALLVGAMLFSSPAKPAQAALPPPPSLSPTYFCYLNGMLSFPITDASGYVGKVLLSVTNFLLPNGQTESVTVTETQSLGGNTWQTLIVVSVSGCPAPISFKDGRCNQDSDQSVAIYPDGIGGFFFFAIYKNVGFLPWHVSKATLDKYPARSNGYLMMQKNGIKLYRLPNGEIEAVRLKPDGGNYQFIMGTNCGVSHS